MKIGETEISDAVIEAELKKSGQRIVKEDDFLSKAEQANLVAKARSVLGEKFDNIDELGRIVKSYEEIENKSKTQLELAMAQAKELEKQLTATRGEVQKARFEAKKREVDDWFQEGQEVLKIKVIEPILRPFKEELYNLKDDEMQNVEFLRKLVEEKLNKAAEEQKGELVRLGLAGITAEEAKGASFGGGHTTFTKPSNGRQITSTSDLWAISKETAASSINVPIYDQRRKT